MRVAVKGIMAVTDKRIAVMKGMVVVVIKGVTMMVKGMMMSIPY